jgi:hypothetical protein
MSKHLRVRSVYREAFTAYKAIARTLLPFAAILFVPVSMIGAIGGDDGIILSGDHPIWFTLLATAAAALLTIGTLICSGVAEQLFDDLKRGKRGWWTWRRIRELPLGKLAVLDVLVAVIVFAGFALVFIPGVIALTYLSVSAVALTAENTTIRGSMRRSARLVRGDGFQVWLALLWPFLAQQVVTWVVVVAESAIPTPGLVDRIVTSWVTSLIFVPFEAIVLVVLFHALRQREPLKRRKKAAAATPSDDAPSQTATSSTPPSQRPAPR